MALTDAAVRKLRPKDKLYKRADADGLYIAVTPTGGKFWRIKYYWQRKERPPYSVGEFPQVSLAKARETCRWLRECLRRSVDPMQARSEQERAARLAVESSFENVARRWHTNAKGGWSARHAQQVLLHLERDAFPELGSVVIGEITAPDILRTVRRVEARGALEMASKLLSKLETICAFAVGEGLAAANVAAGLEKQLKQRKPGAFAYMDREMFTEFLRKLPESRAYPATRIALKVAALSMLRPGEVAKLEWSEIDIANKVIRLPAEKMKLPRAHLVPLSEQLLALLEEVRPYSGERYVFPNYRNRLKPISENCMLYALYDLGYYGRATVHGFRKTSSTLLNEMGFRPDVIERQLSHEPHDKVRGIYNRAEYLPERAAMLQAWADFADGLKDGAAVIPLRAQSR